MFDFVFAAFCLGSLPAAAQQPAQAPPASASAQSQSKPDEKNDAGQSGASAPQAVSSADDRIFWALPNFLERF